jgi:serine phosphatase RsbU (regulator of sigma subunit)
VAFATLAGATLPAEANVDSHLRAAAAPVDLQQLQPMPPGHTEAEPPQPGPDSDTKDAGKDATKDPPLGALREEGRGGSSVPVAQAAQAPATTPRETGSSRQRASGGRRSAARRRVLARPPAAPRRAVEVRRGSAADVGDAVDSGSASGLAATDAGQVSPPQPDRSRVRRGDERTGGTPAPAGESSTVTRSVRDVVDHVPDELRAALALLAALSIILGAGYLLAAMRARRLKRQRGELLQEIGLLQSALLPPVPDTVGAVTASVAYRPADGPAAGGDFYDALTLSGGRAAFILGDVSGHGRAALAHTAFMRYTLRAYLEAGLEPRLALQVAERAIGGQLDGDFATVIVAIHDPADGSLTYASSGHPAPIVAGAAEHDPVPVGWSPPIGWGLRTGMRQTTVPLPSGAIVCLYTDGVADVATSDGPLGRAGLAEIVAGYGREGSAQDVIDAVAERAIKVRDDMAVCLIAPVRYLTAETYRVELLELSGEELAKGIASQFLHACNVPDADVEVAEEETREVALEHAGALLVVCFDVRGPRVKVLPRNVESIQAAALERTSAARLSG